MSSLSASLCLFSAALCNVAVLDQKLFEQQGNQNQQQVVGNGALINQATNLFGNFANQGLGVLTGNRQGQGNGQRQGQGQGQGNGQGQKPKAPHQSPCRNKFQYVTDGREWKGIIRLKNVDINRDTLLEVDFVLPQGAYKRVSQTNFCIQVFTQLYFVSQNNQNNGRIELVNQGDSIYEDLANGLPLLFEIIFPSQNPVPKLVSIHKNKKEICGGPIGIDVDFLLSLF